MISFTILKEFIPLISSLGANPKEASNWITTRILGYVNTNNIEFTEIFMTPAMLINMLEMISSGKISTHFFFNYKFKFFT